jgi:hypothetical protein
MTSNIVYYVQGISAVRACVHHPSTSPALLVACLPALSASWQRTTGNANGLGARRLARAFAQLLPTSARRRQTTHHVNQRHLNAISFVLAPRFMMESFYNGANFGGTDYPASAGHRYNMLYPNLGALLCSSRRFEVIGWPLTPNMTSGPSQPPMGCCDGVAHSWSQQHTKPISRWRLQSAQSGPRYPMSRPRPCPLLTHSTLMRASPQRKVSCLGGGRAAGWGHWGARC